MAAAVPDTKQLLELLKRAADELKVSQQETAALKTEAEALRNKASRLEAELEQERAKARASLDIGSMTLPLMKRLQPDERTNVFPSDANLLEHRMAMLQDDLNTVDTERRTLKEQLRASEEALIKEREAATAALARFEEQARESGKSELDSLVTQNSKLETELTSAQARLQVLEAQRTELETAVATKHSAWSDATNRVTQLEQEIAALRMRRDGLNVELAHVEKDRNSFKTRVGELEAQLSTHAQDEAKVRDALEASYKVRLGEAAARVSELEALVAKEKEKHQLTAQRLLEARARGRELEAELEKASTQLSQASAAQAQVAQQHRDALLAETARHDKVVAEFESRRVELEQRLEHTTSEYHHVNRQYEQLHREMLVMLDQRDEARREVEALRSNSLPPLK